MARNVALICLDTVRKDYFERYAPRLQERADVTFEQCRAASSCSVPSHASFMTGELPHRHGIDSFHVDYSTLDRSNTFLGDLPDHRALGVSANAFAGSPFGFDEMFDAFTDVSWTRRFPQGMDAEEYATRSDAEGLAFYMEFLSAALRHDHPLQTMANAALAQFDISVSSRLPIPKLLDDGAKAVFRESARLIEASPEPFFLFVNAMDAHVPHQPTLGYDRSLYAAPNTWTSITAVDEWEVMLDGVDAHRENVERFRELYGASIDYLDRQVCAFIDRVQAHTDGETTFVITADHGENLGFPADDGGLFGHMSSLSEALLHVPLAVVNPPEGYPEYEQGYVSQLRLGELISGMAHGETPDVVDDRIAAERIGTSIYGVEMDDDDRTYYGRMLRCVYEDDRKVVWDSLGGCDAYGLDRARPCWQTTLVEDAEPPAWADAFFDVPIETYRERVDDEGSLREEVDAHTEARLADLGYL